MHLTREDRDAAASAHFCDASPTLDLREAPRYRAGRFTIGRIFRDRGVVVTRGLHSCIHSLKVFPPYLDVATEGKDDTLCHNQLGDRLIHGNGAE